MFWRYVSRFSLDCAESAKEFSHEMEAKDSWGKPSVAEDNDTPEPLLEETLTI